MIVQQSCAVMRHPEGRAFFMSRHQDQKFLAPQQFQLFVERAAHTASAQACDRVDVPTTGAAWITADASSIVIGASPSPAAIAIETIAVDRQPCLALCAPPNENLRVNGMPCGPQCVVGLKDVVELPGGAVFHVSQIRRPYVGKARAQDIGRACPICLAPVSGEAQVLVCCGCDTVLHDRNPNNEEQVQCALTTRHCPTCGVELARTEETVYAPEI